MKSVSKKRFAAAAVLLMIFLVTGMVMLRTGAADDSGSCGDTVTYSFDSDTGTLTVSGTGAMTDYSSGSSISTSSIPWYSYRTDISSIVIEDGVTHIGFGAFYGTDAAMVTMADSVTSMGYGAFDQCNELIAITLSENLTDIPNYCFYNDKLLASITLPSSLKTIGDCAFEFCEKLNHVVIPDGVTELGVNAFAYDYLLADLTIPDSVETIGSGAFSGVPYVEETTEPLIVGNGIFLKYGGTDTSYTVPASVKTIANSAFFGNETLTSVVIPSSVTEIGSSAFANMEQLSELTIPSSVTKIGAKAIDGTAFLANNTDDFVILGNGILYIYQGNEETVVIPDGVTRIESEAFYKNLSVRSITIPEGVTTLEDGAIHGCAKLNLLVVPSTIVELGEYSICYYYSEISSGTATVLSDSYLIVTGPENEAVEEYCDNIGKTYYCTADLSGTVTDTISYRIDPETKTLTISGTGALPSGSTYPWSSYSGLIQNLVVEDGITEIGSCYFGRLTNLNRVSLPDTLESIGNLAFRYCTSLTEITIPKSVSSISYSAFYDCTKLEEITVEDGNAAYTSVDGVLYKKNSSSLTAYFCPTGITGTVTLAENTTGTSGYSFYHSQAEAVIIPETVTSIGSYSFYYSSTEALIFKGACPTSIGSSAVYPYTGSSYKKTIYYNSGKSYWKTKVTALSSTWTAVTFTDVSGRTGLSDSSIELSAGEAFTLTFADGSALSDCTITSKNPKTVSVSEDGTLVGCAPGTARITVTDNVTGNVFTCTVTVTGSEDSSSIIELPEAIAYTSYSTLFVDTYSAELDGYYYLLGSKLHFISYSANTDITLYTFTGATDAFVQGSRLYVLGNNLVVYDLDNRTIVDELSLPDGNFSAVGVDENGCIYLYNSETGTPVGEILVLSSDGKKLAEADSYTQIYRFTGFDSTNGNFYTESYYNWRYWGYDHAVISVYSGRYADGTLSFFNTVVSCGTASSLQEALLGTGNLNLYQHYFYDHQKDSELLGNRFLVASSTLYGKLYIMDSNAYTPSENDGKSVSISRSGTDPNTTRSTQSVGTLTAYNEEEDSIIVYENSRKIEDIDPETGTVLSTYSCKYPLFSMKYADGYLILVEKDSDGVFYIEKINWKAPTELTVLPTLTVPVAKETTLPVTNNSSFTGTYTYTSSDNTVASVTSDGSVVAWKEGTAVITVTWEQYGLSSTCTVTVPKNSARKTTDTHEITLSGNTASNASANNYTVWSNPVDSYLHELSDGNYERVQNLGNGTLLVETYSSTFAKLSSKTITLPYSLFGGFYHTEDANYVLVGQQNPNEDDTLEVMRLIKYDSDWNVTGTYSFKDINTYIPFDAGSCRMLSFKGKLYIYTCHEMYQSSDGYHHQANMTFVMNEEDLTLSDSYYEVMNTSYGYVSHSFNQFITADESNIIRADHGDASPRGIYVSYTGNTSAITSPWLYGTIYGISGSYGANATGVSFGGFAEGEGNVLAAINSVAMDSGYSAYGKRNIYLVVMGTDDFSNVLKLTDYTSESTVTVRTPELVKLDVNHFLMLWETYNSETGKINTWLCQVDSDGNKCCEPVMTNYRLSDCQPIVNSDGFVVWYVADGSRTTAYVVDPYNLSDCEVPADPTGISLDRTNVILAVNGSAVLTATVTPANAVKTVTWSSANTAIVKVDAAGNLTAVAPGKTTVTVKTENASYSASAFVYVKEQTPSASVDTEHLLITGLTGGARYLISGTTYTASADGTISIDKSWSDKSITIVKVNSVSTCNSNAQTLSIPHIHNYTEGISEVATCIKEGFVEYSCSCGDSYRVTIPMTDHNYLTSEVTLMPTEDTPGTRVWTCGFCGATKEEEIPYVTITLCSDSVTLPTNSKLNLLESVSPAGTKLIWKSVLPDYVSVDSEGNITAKRYNVAPITITATTEDGLFSASCEVQPLFYDVAGSNNKNDKANYQYYYDPVYWAAGFNITTGYDGVYFGVGENCTRSAVMIFLWRYLGSQEPENDARQYFSDLSAYGTNTATNKAIAWAYEKGITKGYSDGTFGVKKSITRKDVLIMLYRLDGKPTQTNAMKFTDCGAYKPGTDTYNAILWGAENGITGGYSDGTFKPVANCLREQIITFLYRYWKLATSR